MKPNILFEYNNLLDFSIFLNNVYTVKDFDLNCIQFLLDIGSIKQSNVSLHEFYFKNLKINDVIAADELNLISKIDFTSFYLNVDEYWSKIICFNTLHQKNKPNSFSLLLLSMIEEKNIRHFFKFKTELVDPNLFLYKLFQDSTNHLFVQLLKMTILKFNPDMFDFNFTLESKSETIILNELNIIYKDFNFQGYCHLLPKSIFKSNNNQKTQLIFLENSYSIVPSNLFVSNKKNEPYILDFCFKTASKIFIFVSRFSTEIKTTLLSCLIYINNINYTVYETTNQKIFQINCPNIIDIKIKVEIKTNSNTILKTLIPINVVEFTFNTKNQSIRLETIGNIKNNINEPFGYNFNTFKIMTTFFNNNIKLKLFQVEYSYKSVNDRQSAEYKIEQNYYSINFSFVTFIEPNPSNVFAFMYYILRLDNFTAIKNEMLKKFLKISRKQYRLTNSINNFYDINNITDPDELCSLLRLQNIFINILKLDEKRNNVIISNFFIAGHENYEGYTDFKNLKNITCEKINFTIKYTNVYLKNLNLELYLVKSKVLYNFTDNNGNYFNVIMLDFYLKCISADNLFDTIVEFKIEKELVKFNVEDKSFICNTDPLADYEHTMFKASDLNYQKNNIEILVKIESIIQTTRFILIQNKIKYMDNILINVEIENVEMS